MTDPDVARAIYDARDTFFDLNKQFPSGIVLPFGTIQTSYNNK